MTALQDAIQLQSHGECCSNARASIQFAKKCRGINSRSGFLWRKTLIALRPTVASSGFDRF